MSMFNRQMTLEEKQRLLDRMVELGKGLVQKGVLPVYVSDAVDDLLPELLRVLHEHELELEYGEGGLTCR